ncbi:hypothetical protein G6F23_015397 [Rhizopus arrhizus]|nr:hypothetical protein G6F23_015397 [Rhizopus arrhizus]
MLAEALNILFAIAPRRARRHQPDHQSSNSDLLSQEDPCGAIAALTNAQEDHVVSKEGVSTFSLPITDLIETNIESDSEDSGDSDYVPSNE